MSFFCVECDKTINPKLVRGYEVYKNRPDLAKLYFYKCVECGNFVGCVGRTKKPLGNVIANKEVKDKRTQIHTKYTAIINSGIADRDQLNDILCVAIKKNSFRIANLRTKEQFETVYKILDEIEWCGLEEFQDYQNSIKKSK